MVNVKEQVEAAQPGGFFIYLMRFDNRQEEGR